MYKKITLIIVAISFCILGLSNLFQTNEMSTKSIKPITKTVIPQEIIEATNKCIKEHEPKVVIVNDFSDDKIIQNNTVKKQIVDTSYQDNIHYMAAVMAHECYQHEYYDMLCVGMTILNRVDHANYPNTVYAVITQPSQMTYYLNGIPDVCYQAATEVYNAYLHNKTFSNGYSWIYTLYWGASGGTTNNFY